MGNPENERTTINVKGMSATAWERAKVAANRNGEAMGAWLTRAVTQLADREAGAREIPPQPANLAPATGNRGSLGVEQLAELMHGMAALAAATGTPPAKPDIRRAYHLVDEHIREARGMPPRPIRVRVGKAGEQSLLGNGRDGHLNGSVQ